jgi:hypothetical protein
VLAVELRHHARADLRAIVTASAQEPGRWQLTWFDDDGPSGHTHRDTAEEAIAAAIADGYHVLLTAYPEDARELVDGALEAQAARRREIESWLAEQ